MKQDACKLPLVVRTQPARLGTGPGLDCLARAGTNIAVMALLSSAPDCSIFQRVAGRKTGTLKEQVLVWIRALPLHTKTQKGESVKVVVVQFAVGLWSQSQLLADTLSLLSSLVVFHSSSGGPLPATCLKEMKQCNLVRFIQGQHQSEYQKSGVFKEQIAVGLAADTDSMEFASVVKRTAAMHALPKHIDGRPASGDLLASMLKHLLSGHPDNNEILAANNSIARAYNYYLTLQKPLQAPNNQQLSQSLDYLRCCQGNQLYDYCEQELRQKVKDYVGQRARAGEQKKASEFQACLANAQRKLSLSLQIGAAQFLNQTKILLRQFQLYQFDSKNQNFLRKFVQQKLVQGLQHFAAQVRQLSEKAQKESQLRKTDEEAKSVKTDHSSSEKSNFLKIISSLQHQLAEAKQWEEIAKRRVQRDSARKESLPLPRVQKEQRDCGQLQQTITMLRFEKSQLESMLAAEKQRAQRRNLVQEQLIRQREKTIEDIIADNGQYKEAISREMQEMARLSKQEAMDYRAQFKRQAEIQERLESQIAQLEGQSAAQVKQLQEMSNERRREESRFKSQISEWAVKLKRLEEQVLAGDNLKALYSLLEHKASGLESDLQSCQEQLRLAKLQSQRQSALFQQKSQFYRLRQQSADEEREQLKRRLAMFSEVITAKEEAQRSEVQKLNQKQQEELTIFKSVLQQFKQEVAGLRKQNFELEAKNLQLQNQADSQLKQIGKLTADSRRQLPSLSRISSIDQVSSPALAPPHRNPQLDYERQVCELRQIYQQEREQLLKRKQVELRSKLQEQAAQFENEKKHLEHQNEKLAGRLQLSVARSFRLEEEIMRFKQLQEQVQLLREELAESQEKYSRTQQENTQLFKKTFETRTPKQERVQTQQVLDVSIIFNEGSRLREEKSQIATLDKIRISGFQQVKAAFIDQIKRLEQDLTEAKASTAEACASYEQNRELLAKQLQQKGAELMACRQQLQQSLYKFERLQSECMQKQNQNKELKKRLEWAGEQVGQVQKKYQYAKKLLTEVEINFRKEVDRLKQDGRTGREGGCGYNCQQKLILATHENQDLRLRLAHGREHQHKEGIIVRR